MASLARTVEGDALALLWRRGDRCGAARHFFCSLTCAAEFARHPERFAH
jgi:hypothetical protein